MYVQVDLEQGLAYVEDLHDAHDLSLVVSRGTADADVDRVLGDAGRIVPDDADHADLSLGWVRAAAAPQAPADWSQRFDALVDRARSKGRLSEDGSTIRVHVQYTMLDE